MISLITERLFSLSGKFGITEDTLVSQKSRLIQYQNGITERNQGFPDILDDDAMIKEIETYAQKVKGKYQSVVLLGIGGSALGPRTIRNALTHQYSHAPKLYIVDNVDPTRVQEILDEVELSTTLFIVISKSGRTPETFALYSFFRSMVDIAGLEAKDHFVAITDPENGLLKPLADKEGMPRFEIPQNVGGRFSVLTPVGLLPAALIGVNIQAMIDGAKTIREMYQSTDVMENVPFQIAYYQSELIQHGITNTVMMPYVQKLSTFGAWYAQLLAESTGKIDVHGNHVGLTPISALGVTDQHSQLQLYAQGPNDKMIITIRETSARHDLPIPRVVSDEAMKFLEGVSFRELLDTEHKATLGSLTEAERPNITLDIPMVDAESLGALFFAFEGATAYLGEMMEINAFDQPGVERSKVLTKEYLSKY